VLPIALMEVLVEDVEFGLDAAGFRALYDDALPRIYGYFLHRVGGAAPVAEDLTQETFLAAVTELRRGRRPGTPLPWLFGIARHKLLDHYRRQRRADTPTALDAEAPDESFLDVDADDAGGRAKAALSALPAAQRAALVLRYLEGFSNAEIARAIGRSEKAVESLIDRGRSNFKRAYLEAS
jgi:RNA polymerase sigma-70 factor, ECF subfamily